MDMPISPAILKRRRQKRWWLGCGTVVALALVTLGLSRLQPAAPVVEKSSIWIDTVKRGEMLRQVRGNGTLVPEDIRWIPTISPGRVEQILVLPGSAVKADTVLVELSNPDLEQAAFEAESQVKAAQAAMANLRVQLESQKLTQRAAVASAEANYTGAKLDFEVNEELGRSGLVAALTVKQARSKAEQLATLLEIERDRLKMGVEAAQAQIAEQIERIAQFDAQLELKRRQIGALKVRAGMDGVLQRLGDLAGPLQVGQQLSAGALVARVANPAKLKAAIRIAETQARDIQLDQFAEIDTRNGVIPGRVIRIDPAVENGTVTVDVALDGPLPRGARPDLSVDGTVQLERLEDVMYLGRPVQGQPDSTVGLFKLVDSGKGAVRVAVKLGRCSVSTVEIVDGLQVGEQVVLSDMSQWDAQERLRLK
ncbi:MAG: HlyD family efflux transporter periplasmic adaptor subunit [Verrucomicrobia bacterium]|nr:HlyD family efflux transporter periplasmic adaptor subunit [Verrucomicrobiota bacterium]